LAAKWDWSPIQVKGTIHVHSFANLANAGITPASRDALITGRGPVPVELTGADFEFVEPAATLQSLNGKKLMDLVITLPKGQQQGEQTTIETVIDTTKLAAGTYTVAIKQENGATGNVSLTVHPRNPELTQVPVRVNIGEPQQTVTLHGKHLERMEQIISPGAQWTLAAVPKGANDLSKRSATVKLDATIRAGDNLNAELAVPGLEEPLKVEDIATVVGARPKIVSATKSFASRAGVELRDGEVPSGGSANFALNVENVDARPIIQVACNKDQRTRKSVTLNPGEKSDFASFDVTGPGSLFLTLEPGMIGDSGCELVAQVTETETGTSDKFVLGRVIRLPHIDKLDLTDQKVADNAYSGILTGQDLQLIEKTGWAAATALAVQGIPTPVPGNPQEQTLNISMPWPPPSPKAPLYIWLRGETQPRQTTVRY